MFGAGTIFTCWDYPILHVKESTGVEIALKYLRISEASEN